MSSDIRVFRAPVAVLPDGEAAADIVVTGFKITEIAPYGSVTGHPVEDLGDAVLLPGLVDSHVHVNEPGRTEWEGFHSATRAAAAGGVTTLIDMPLNSIPPTTTVTGLKAKQEAARGRAFVDVGFWGGAIPGNTADLAPLYDAGVFGFKAFLSPSGVEEFPHLTQSDLDEALAELARIDALAIIHAEAHDSLEAAPQIPGRKYTDFLASRPGEAETEAVSDLLSAAATHQARVHILHVSAAGVMPLLAAARADGVKVTAETCPHYLAFTSEEIPDGDTAYKCCPPIREEGNRDLLWDSLRNGEFIAVVSDHSPSTADLKLLDTGDFAAAWGGIASIQLGLPAMWTEARKRGFTLSDIVRWMASGPAELAGLEHKGAIAVGNDADLVAFEPDADFTVDPQQLHHKNPITPYSGLNLTGVVRATWLRGTRIDTDGTPRGELITRTTK